MYKLLDRFYLTILVSSLVIVSSNPAIAKPQTRSRVIVISQAVARSKIIRGVSPQPVAAILANARFKLLTPNKVRKAATRQVLNTHSVARMEKIPNHVNDRSSQGLAAFIDVDRVSTHTYRSVAIDRLTN
jgi:hypothetical protein